MIRVLLAAPQANVREALRLFLLNLGMQVVGEAADWSAVLAAAQRLQPQVILVDWDTIPINTELVPLRAACAHATVIVLVNQLTTRQHANLAGEADLLISKGVMPDEIARQLRNAVANVHS